MTAPHDAPPPGLRDPLLDAVISQLLAARDLVDGALRGCDVLRQRTATLATLERPERPTGGPSGGLPRTFMQRLTPQDAPPAPPAPSSPAASPDAGASHAEVSPA